MNIVALLTGRGNNTLKDKNILPVLGKPLMYYPATAVKNSKYVTHKYTSSDDTKILSFSEEYGFKNIMRPEELAKPNSQHVDAINHALNFMRIEDNVVPDILIVILANNAIIKTEWIDKCIEEIINNDEVSAAVPVFEDCDHHPYRAKKIDKNGNLQTFFDFKGKTISTNRQDLEPSYFLCHNFWVLNLKKSMTDDGQNPWRFMGNYIKPYIVKESFDVHTLEDIKRTERWLNENW